MKSKIIQIKIRDTVAGCNKNLMLSPVLMKNATAFKYLISEYV